MSKETYKKIAEFGKTLATQNEIDNALELIAEEAKKLLAVERCSIFIVDKEAMMLWTKHSDGIGRIAIGIDSGIAGDTYKTQEPQLVNDPYEDERFLPKIDEKSGFTTRNIMTVPIFDSKRDVIGVIQLLNKSEGEFSQEDLDILTFLANYVSGTIELVLMVEG
jgi:GAF domain-containing protein